MNATKVKSLPLAIGLNLLFPGLGYLYMGKWLVGILGGLLIVGIYATTGLLFLIPTWIVLNLIMVIDMLILSNKNKSRVLAESMMKCPSCAELIQREAKVCRFCSFKLTNDQNISPSPASTGIATPNEEASSKAGSAPDSKPESSIPAWVVVAVVAVGASVLLVANQKKPATDAAHQSSGLQSSAPTVTEALPAPRPPAAEPSTSPKYTVGDTVKTKYFDITVHKVSNVGRINPNALTDLVANEDERFVVLDVTVKNTDIEGRMFFPGKLQANVGGKTLTFDVSETVFDEDFMLMENMNPLTSIRKKIAFRIPKVANSGLVWIPARTKAQIALMDRNSEARPPTTATTAPRGIGYKAAKTAFNAKEYSAAAAACAPMAGDPDCDNLLGVLYANGAGVPKDLTRAAELYRAAADKGHAKAQFNLAFLIGKDLVPGDANELFSLALKSAKQDWPLAKVLLADLYAGGIGTPVDIPQAVHWYRSALQHAISESFPEQVKVGAQDRLDKLLQKGEIEEKAATR